MVKCIYEGLNIMWGFDDLYYPKYNLSGSRHVSDIFLSMLLNQIDNLIRVHARLIELYT